MHFIFGTSTQEFVSSLEISYAQLSSQWNITRKRGRPSVLQNTLAAVSWMRAADTNVSMDVGSVPDL